jgi:hypothetical protein
VSINKSGFSVLNTLRFCKIFCSILRGKLLPELCVVTLKPRIGQVRLEQTYSSSAADILEPVLSGNVAMEEGRNGVSSPYFVNVPTGNLHNFVQETCQSFDWHVTPPSSVSNLTYSYVVNMESVCVPLVNFYQTTRCYVPEGRAIVQAVSRRLPTAAAQVWGQVSTCGICCEQSGTGQVFSEYLGFPC